MTDSDAQPTDGLVILALRIRDPDRREQVIDRLVNSTANRVTSNLFELHTADWDDGLWDEEVQWLIDLLEGSRDSIIVWRFVKGSFIRFTIADG
jgi:hypothetical protein